MAEKACEQGPGFPLTGYVYAPDGFHGGPMAIPCGCFLRLWMMIFAPRAIAEKTEAMICDSGDFCVFHIKDGKVVYAGDGVDCAALTQGFEEGNRKRQARMN